jgi:hypothetical protein
MSGVTLAIFTGLLGFWLGGLRERYNRTRRAKDEFLHVIASQRAKFDGMGFKELEFYDQSLPVIGEAVYKVKPYLKPSTRDALQAILVEYQSHHGKNTFSRTAVFDSFVSEEMFGQGKNAIQLLKEYHDRFATCVDPEA